MKGDFFVNEHVTTSTDRELPFLPVMAYVPRQELQTVYEPENALACGTLFPEIFKPFKGGRRNG